MIENTVKLFLEKYDLLKPKNNIIVAFSGGYDSMCLLDVMKKLSIKYDINLIAVHLNHGWRGQESDNEEIVCKNFASDITFYSEKLSSAVPHTETAARDKRYEFFEKCAEKFNSCVVLTAHNANDNAETVFYRITKGTGITGLEGIRERRDIYYRPLLSVYRDDIEEYCRKNDLAPNSDSSNSDVKYARNKIRNEIFPLMPGIVQKLNELSESAKFTNMVVEKSLRPLEMYSTADFCKLDRFLQCSVVHKFYRDNGFDYDKDKIERVVDFIVSNSETKAGSKISITSAKWLFVNSDKISLISEAKKEDLVLAINKEGSYKFGDREFSILKTENVPERFPDDKDFCAYINLDNIDFLLRTRRDGDIISPLGLSGTQKLKKYLNAKHIPAHERDSIVVLAQGNEVLWAAGVGISEKVKVTSEPVYEIRLKG